MCVCCLSSLARKGVERTGLRSQISRKYEMKTNKYTVLFIFNLKYNRPVVLTSRHRIRDALEII